MDKIKKIISTYFWFALGLSVGFPLGVLGIVFGAVNGIVPLLILGIVLVVGGFYVMPILWIKYGESRRDRSILFMIENEHIYTVSGLSAQTGLDEKTVREKLKKMIMSHVLVGYLLKDDVLELNTNLKQEKGKGRTQKCNNCGAFMIFDGLKFRCEYCGNTAKEEK